MNLNYLNISIFFYNITFYSYFLDLLWFTLIYIATKKKSHVSSFTFFCLVNGLKVDEGFNYGCHGLHNMLEYIFVMDASEFTQRYAIHAIQKV